MIITDINVEGDDFRVKSEDRETTIRIGSSSESLIGPHTYDISYTIIFPQDYRDDCDFIFYSPLGAQWDTTIDSFSFTLNLDKGLTKKEMDQVNIYSGSMGNETNSLNVDYTVEKNRISGTASDIYPNEAVTVFARMHDGYFVGAEHVNPTPAWIVAMITAVLVAFVFLKERMTQSKTFTETVEFYPPENTSSAEVGYIVDGSAEVTDLMSLIPYWANKGILTIEDSGRNSFILHKQKELPADAHDYEQTVMRALFLEGDSVDIKDLGTNFARLMEAAQTQLKDAFTGDRKLSSWKTATAAASLISIFAFMLTVTLNSKMGLFPNGVVAIIAGVLALTLAAIQMSESTRRHFLGKSTFITKVVTVIISIALFIIVTIFSTGHDRILPIPFMAILFLLLLLMMLGLHRLNQPTDYWLDSAGKLAGLKTFIQKAELPQLEKLSKENPSYYFDVIPYAMAFGLSKQWAKAFENIPVAKPSWYASDRAFDSYYYYNMFDRSITHTASSAVSSYQAAQSSSSGGFSGGGGGGGGGRSW